MNLKIKTYHIKTKNLRSAIKNNNAHINKINIWRKGGRYLEQGQLKMKEQISAQALLNTAKAITKIKERL